MRVLMEKRLVVDGEIEFYDGFGVRQTLKVDLNESPLVIQLREYDDKTSQVVLVHGDKEINFTKHLPDYGAVAEFFYYGLINNLYVKYISIANELNPFDPFLAFTDYNTSEIAQVHQDLTEEETIEKGKEILETFVRIFNIEQKPEEIRKNITIVTNIPKIRYTLERYLEDLLTYIN